MSEIRVIFFQVLRPSYEGLPHQALHPSITAVKDE
uniref:Uncharacterized protein n=1 Tax=Anguilla anguilla TaxID=7936 RepID=A0A0E9U763_ANGAN